MKTLKLLSAISLFLLLLVTTSCKESNQNTEAENTKTVVKEESKPIPTKASSNSNYLCKVNGKDWGYTEASGIVSRHKKTGKRTAIITFKKKLEKGSESIQLYYDGDSFELEQASLQLKFPKKGGGRVSGFYGLHADTRARNPNSDMSGKLDLFNLTEAAGNAELVNFNIKYEKELLENMGNAVVSVTGLEFSGIGYSDLTKAFESLNNKK